MSYTMHTSFVVHVSLELGDDGHDVAADINYSVIPGYPDTLEEPGCGPEVSINSIKIDGSDVPGWLFEMAEADPSLTQELLAHAADCDEDARQRAHDARREEYGK